MSLRQKGVSDIQAKLATGKQLVNPSDDPSKANLIARLESARERQSVYTKNLDSAQTHLVSEESVLATMTEIMQRISELTIQGGNDTLGAGDRNVIGTEIGALRDELLSLANTQDAFGNYLFSGNKVTKPAFTENSSGVVTYNGDYGRLEVNISDDRKMAINTLGHEMFSTADFAALDTLVTKLKANDGTAVRTQLGNVNTISDKLAVAYGAMAGRVQAIESHRLVIEETELRLDQLLMQESDLDYASAVTELSKESLGLQALQASFAKITQMTLFNYLR